MPLIASLWLLGKPLSAEAPQIEASSKIAYNDCFLDSRSVSPITVKTPPKAILSDKNTIQKLVSTQYPYLYDIIRCESSFNPGKCNEQYGCYAGQGLAQIIPNTLRHCERMLGLDLDVFNAEDNLKCADYLYKTQGTVPWNSSISCWGS